MILISIILSSIFSNVVLEDDMSVKKTEASNTSSFIVSRDPFFRELDQFILDDKKVSATDLDLSELNLIGVISGNNKSMAMFKGPYESRFLLKYGDSIGRRGGIIRRINSNGVTIVEKNTDVDGHITERTIVKRLQK
jgi:Tfp pilus assembly protein PilP